MKTKTVLFLRGFILAACFFALTNLDAFFSIESQISMISISGMLLGCIVIGYCSMKFAKNFWEGLGLSRLSHK